MSAAPVVQCVVCKGRCYLPVTYVSDRGTSTLPAPIRCPHCHGTGVTRAAA